MQRSAYTRPAAARHASQGQSNIVRTDGTLVSVSQATLAHHTRIAPPEVRLCLELVRRGHALTAAQEQLCREYYQSIVQQ